MGKETFADRPRDFMRQMEQLWEAWQLRARRTKKMARVEQPAEQVASA